jgi:hypothetical protein
MRITRILMVSAAMTLAAGSLQAQSLTNTCNGTSSAKSDFATCQVASNVKVEVPYIATAAASGNITSGVRLTNADLDAGFKEFAGPTLSVKSNFVYNVTVSAGTLSSNLAEDRFFVASSNAAGGTYSDFTATRTIYTAMATVGTSNSGATASHPTYLKFNGNWENTLPGDRTATLTFTIVAP